MGDQISPIGVTVSEHIAECREDPDFRAEYERLRPYEELARIVRVRRAALGWTQAELAARMGSRAAAVSRIESGQYATNAQTLRKLADAFGVRAVIGFESGSAKNTQSANWSRFSAGPFRLHRLALVLAEEEHPGRVSRGGPAKPAEQLLRRNAQATAQPEERVGASDPLTTLKLANRGAVKISHVAQLFLTDPHRFAAASEVLAEHLGENRIAPSRPAHR